MKRIKNLKITPNTHKILKEYCEEHGLKMFQYVELLIKRNCIPTKQVNDMYGEN